MASRVRLLAASVAILLVGCSNIAEGGAPFAEGRAPATESGAPTAAGGGDYVDFCSVVDGEMQSALPSKYGFQPSDGETDASFLLEYLDEEVHTDSTISCTYVMVQDDRMRGNPRFTVTYDPRPREVDFAPDRVHDYRDYRIGLELTDSLWADGFYVLDLGDRGTVWTNWQERLPWVDESDYIEPMQFGVEPLYRAIADVFAQSLETVIPAEQPRNIPFVCTQLANAVNGLDASRVSAAKSFTNSIGREVYFPPEAEYFGEREQWANCTLSSYSDPDAQPDARFVKIEASFMVFTSPETADFVTQNMVQIAADCPQASPTGTDAPAECLDLNIGLTRSLLVDNWYLTVTVTREEAQVLFPGITADVDVIAAMDGMLNGWAASLPSSTVADYVNLPEDPRQGERIAPVDTHPCGPTSYALAWSSFPDGYVYHCEGNPRRLVGEHRGQAFDAPMDRGMDYCASLRVTSEYDLVCWSYATNWADALGKPNVLHYALDDIESVWDPSARQYGMQYYFTEMVE